MARMLNEKIADFNYDNLINQNYPVGDVFTIEVDEGQGVLLRGTVMALDADSGIFYILGTEAEASQVLGANCIISDDADTDTGAGGTIYVQAYRTGHFNRNMLITKEDYELSLADEESLRKCGILLSDAI